MASPAQIAANKLNSRRSTGPRSPQGQAKSSMNALKHGNRSRKLALLREESCAFEDRLCKWMAIGEAQNDVEEYLVYRNVCLSFDLDRAERARVERCTSLIENSDEEEVAEAHAVGKQLFFDPAGPTPLYGNRTFFSPENKTSWSGQAVDPNNPAALVRILERNAVGCCWLRDEWQALRTQLESTGFWQSHDRLKAIRLLGRQPVQANEDLRVATIFVASHALGPAGPSEFADLRSDMEDSQRSRYAKGIRERWPDLFRTREKAEWRQMLLALADRNIDRLNAKLEVHEQHVDAQADRAVARESFDRQPRRPGAGQLPDQMSQRAAPRSGKLPEVPRDNEWRVWRGSIALPDSRRASLPARPFGCPSPRRLGRSLALPGSRKPIERRGAVRNPTGLVRRRRA